MPQHLTQKRKTLFGDQVEACWGCLIQEEKALRTFKERASTEITKEKAKLYNVEIMAFQMIIKGKAKLYNAKIMAFEMIIKGNTFKLQTVTQ